MSNWLRVSSMFADETVSDKQVVQRNECLGERRLVTNDLGAGRVIAGRTLPRHDPLGLFARSDGLNVVPLEEHVFLRERLQHFTRKDGEVICANVAGEVGLPTKGDD